MAALATLTHLPYEEIEAVLVPGDFRGNAGLHNRQVVEIAARIGVTLTPTRRYNIATARGILRIRWTCDRAQLAPGGHFVTVERGLVGCPSAGRAMPLELFLETHRPRLCTLLSAD